LTVFIRIYEYNLIISSKIESAILKIPEGYGKNPKYGVHLKGEGPEMGYHGRAEV
jgi:hypothetical protein